MSNNPPPPEPWHVLVALAPLVSEQHMKGRDFSRRYEGYLTVEQIAQFDDLWWLQVRTPDDLRTFRNGEFDRAAAEMPPIVVVTAPVDGVCETRIGDGRGRVNFANAHGLRLHVWHLVHRACQREGEGAP